MQRPLVALNGGCRLGQAGGDRPQPSPHLGPPHLRLRQAVKAMGYKILSFAELQAMGEAQPRDAVPPRPDDLCTIMYTSGTTGDPKVRSADARILRGLQA